MLVESEKYANIRISLTGSLEISSFPREQIVLFSGHLPKEIKETVFTSSTKF